MAIHLDGSADVGSRANMGGTLNGGEYTFYAMALRHSTGSEDTMLSVGNTNLGLRFTVGFASSDVVRVQASNSTSTVQRTLDTTATFTSTSTYYRLLGIVDSDGGDALIDVNGTNYTGTTSTIGSGADFGTPNLNPRIGVRKRTTSDTGFFDGIIAEVAIWDTVLSAQERAIIGNTWQKGAPLNIARANLLNYWACNDQPHITTGAGNTLRDIVGGLDFTSAGTSFEFRAEESGLSYPSRPIFVPSVVAVAAGNPWNYYQQTQRLAG